MDKRWPTLLALLAALALVPVPVAAQGRSDWTPPRTPWGDPDVQGFFTNNDESGIPLERPEEFAGRTLDQVTDEELAELTEARNERSEERAPFLGGLPIGSNPVHWFENFGAQNSRAWLIVDPPDGRVPPMTEQAQQRPRGRGGSSFGNGPFNGPEDLSMYDRCITRGLPGSMLPAIYGNAYQIIQSPGYVAIRYEMVHETRIIPLDGSRHVGGPIRQFMGDARGHFDGDALVIETTNFDPKSTYRNADAGTLRLVERFRPVSSETVEWSVTVDDPGTWTRPWTFAMNLTRVDAQAGPFEYACHEGNYAVRNLLNAARKADREQ